MHQSIRIYGIGILAAVLLAGVSWADEQGAKEEKDAKCIQAIEVFTGFQKANLKDKGSYEAIPVIVDFDFDLKPLAAKFGINPPMMLQFQLEPFISTVYSPDSNVEIGNSFMLKMGFVPDTWKVQPYIKVGVGLDYMTQHIHEQGTQFNFIETGGMGAHFFINSDTALTLEGRYRHLSNCGIDDPNHGINTYFILVGTSHRF